MLTVYTRVGREAKEACRLTSCESVQRSTFMLCARRDTRGLGIILRRRFLCLSETRGVWWDAWRCIFLMNMNCSMAESSSTIGPLDGSIDGVRRTIIIGIERETLMWFGLVMIVKHLCNTGVMVALLNASSIPCRDIEMWLGTKYVVSGGVAADLPRPWHFSRNGGAR